MIASPPNIQSQLGEAVSIIADSDFWERWETLTQVTTNRHPLGLPAWPGTDGVITRILSAASLPPIPRSTLVCWRWPIPSLCAGGR